MKKVIIFNANPSKVIIVLKGITSVRQTYPDGEEINLQIMTASFPSLTEIIILSMLLQTGTYLSGNI